MSYSIPGNASAYNRSRANQATLESLGMSAEEAKQLEDAQLEREYGGGMSKAELQDFDTLINRLEGSKMRQAAQGNRARQRDTMSAGLAGMMDNF
jgi:hypothetical protein